MRLALKWEEAVPGKEWRARAAFFELAVQLEKEAFECWAFNVQIDRRFNDLRRAQEYTERHAERLLRQAIATFQSPTVDIAVRANRLWKALQTYSPPQAVEALAEALITAHNPVDVESLIWASKLLIAQEGAAERERVAVQVALKRFGE